MKKRWFIYSIIGVLFGVFDFYYQEFTKMSSASYLIWFAVACGIWLIPVLHIVLYEAKTSKSCGMSALAGILTWSVSVISYYFFMAVKLIFIGQTTRPELYIANYRDQFYLSNLESLFIGDVLGGIVTWIGVAVIGGGIIGFFVSFVWLRFIKPDSYREGQYEE